jgi:integrase
MYDIRTKRARAELSPRRAPYFVKITPRLSLGFRAGAGTWIARLWDDERRNYDYRPLKDSTDYDEAVKAALAWTESRDEGIDDRPPTVTDIGKEYVKELRDGQKREGAAYDAEVRFKRALYDDELGAMRLDKARTKHYMAWRNRVAGTPAAQERSWRTLRAALNLAVRNRRVSAAVEIEWRSVPALKAADGRRDLFLDRAQRRALIDACEGGLRDLVEAAAVTGCRPGELVKLKRGDFDARTKTLAVRGKTGERRMPLAPAAVALFERLAENKLPAAPLLMQDDGRPWTQTVVWSLGIRDAAKRAELPDGVVLYTLRHAFITEALRAGMSTLDVARLTGTSLPMIESHYGHLVAGDAAKRLAKVKLL